MSEVNNITITIDPKYGFDVLQGGQSSGGGLTLGEMIEQVLSLSVPIMPNNRINTGRPAYRMLPPEEWDRRYPHRQTYKDEEEA